MKQLIAEISVVDTAGNETYNKTSIVDFEIDNVGDRDLQISIELDPIKINKDDALVITFENRELLLKELLKTDFNC